MCDMGTANPDRSIIADASDVISLSDPEYPKIAALIAEADRRHREQHRSRDAAQVRAPFRRLTATTLRPALG